MRHKERHYRMIKGSILREVITILHVYTPNNRASKYMNQKLIELQCLKQMNLFFLLET